MKGMVPCILKQRLINMQRSNETATLAIANTDYIKNVKNKINRWADIAGGNIKHLKAKLSNNLQQSYSGNGLNQGRVDDSSSHWMHSPPPTSGRGKNTANRYN